MRNSANIRRPVQANALGSVIGSGVGMLGGALLGGPAGMTAGNALGGSMGSLIDGIVERKKKKREALIQEQLDKQREEISQRNIYAANERQGYLGENDLERDMYNEQHPGFYGVAQGGEVPRYGLGGMADTAGAWLNDNPIKTLAGVTGLAAPGALYGRYLHKKGHKKAGLATGAVAAAIPFTTTGLSMYSHLFGKDRPSTPEATSDVMNDPYNDDLENIELPSARELGNMSLENLAHGGQVPRYAGGGDAWRKYWPSVGGFGTGAGLGLAGGLAKKYGYNRLGNALMLGGMASPLLGMGYNWLKNRHGQPSNEQLNISNPTLQQTIPQPGSSNYQSPEIVAQQQQLDAQEQSVMETRAKENEKLSQLPQSSRVPPPKGFTTSLTTDASIPPSPLNPPSDYETVTPVADRLAEKKARFDKITDRYNNPNAEADYFRSFGNNATREMRGIPLEHNNRTAIPMPFENPNASGIDQPTETPYSDVPSVPENEMNAPQMYSSVLDNPQKLRGEEMGQFSYNHPRQGMLRNPKGFAQLRAEEDANGLETLREYNALGHALGTGASEKGLSSIYENKPNRPGYSAFSGIKGIKASPRMDMSNYAGINLQPYQQEFTHYTPEPKPLHAYDSPNYGAQIIRAEDPSQTIQGDWTSGSVDVADRAGRNQYPSPQVQNFVKNESVPGGMAGYFGGDTDSSFKYDTPLHTQNRLQIPKGAITNATSAYSASVPPPIKNVGSLDDAMEAFNQMRLAAKAQGGTVPRYGLGGWVKDNPVKASLAGAGIVGGGTLAGLGIYNWLKNRQHAGQFSHVPGMGASPIADAGLQMESGADVDVPGNAPIRQSDSIFPSDNPTGTVVSVSDLPPLNATREQVEARKDDIATKTGIKKNKWDFTPSIEGASIAPGENVSDLIAYAQAQEGMNDYQSASFGARIPRFGEGGVYNKMAFMASHPTDIRFSAPTMARQYWTGGEEEENDKQPSQGSQWFSSEEGGEDTSPYSGGGIDTSAPGPNTPGFSEGAVSGGNGWGQTLWDYTKRWGPTVLSAFKPGMGQLMNMGTSLASGNMLGLGMSAVPFAMGVASNGLKNTVMEDGPLLTNPSQYLNFDPTNGGAMNLLRAGMYAAPLLSNAIRPNAREGIATMGMGNFY